MSQRKIRRHAVRLALESIRPAIQSDGGDVELVGVDQDGIVHVRLSGSCCGCPSAALTLSLGVERTIKRHVPQVKRVICE